MNFHKKKEVKLLIFDLKVNDKNNSTVIIGCGKTNKYYCDIVRPESKNEMRNVFGDCDLTDTYDMMIDMGVSDLFVINIEKVHDYITVSQLLAGYDFSYIVPIDINLLDYYYNPSNNAKKTYYLQYMLRQFYNINESTIIATDTHASMYEDIDAYINTIETNISKFKSLKTGYNDYKNIVYCANMINDVKWSNAYLAAVIATTGIDKYPTYSDTTNTVVFDIDNHDVKADFDGVYFKKHIDNSITIENFLNLDTENSLAKPEFVHRIQKYIFKDLDLTEYIGSIYNEYVKTLILEDLIKYLNNYLNYILVSYDIVNIYAENNVETIGTTVIYIRMRIQPIGCVEKYEVTKIIHGN